MSKLHVDPSTIRIIHRDDYLEWRGTRSDGKEVGAAWRKAPDLDADKFWEMAVHLMTQQMRRECAA